MHINNDPLNNFLFEHICESLYEEENPEMILNEGLKSFISKIMSYPENRLDQLLDKKYDRLEKTVYFHERQLKRAGINTKQIDRAIRSELGKVRNDVTKSIEGGNINRVLNALSVMFDAVRAVLIALNPLEKIKDMHPPDVLKPLLVYTIFTTFKFLVFGILDVAMISFLGIDSKLMAGRTEEAQKIVTWLHRAFRGMIVVFLGPLIDQFGRWVAIQTDSDKNYVKVQNSAEATIFTGYMMHTSGKIVTPLILKAIHVILNWWGKEQLMVAGKEGKDAHKFKTRVVYISEVLRKFVEVMLIGTWEFALPGMRGMY